MREITVNKKDLLAILRKNREIHATEYASAMVGYRKVVKTKLEQALVELSKKDGRVITALRLEAPEPQNHTNDYDRVIGMLEMHQGRTITMDQHEFDNYVNDEWAWTGMTKASVSNYASRV